MRWLDGITDLMDVSLSELRRDGVSREVPCSALKGETVPDSLRSSHCRAEETSPKRVSGST